MRGGPTAGRRRWLPLTALLALAACGSGEPTPASQIATINEFCVDCHNDLDLTAEQIERIQKQAYKEAYEAGFIKGRDEGMASGKAEIIRNGQLLENLLQALATDRRSR